MSHQKNNRHNPVSHKNQVNLVEEIYGMYKQEIEVDTDVNEDPNRERLLDKSVDSFLESKEEQ